MSHDKIKLCIWIGVLVGIIVIGSVLYSIYVINNIGYHDDIVDGSTLEEYMNGVRSQEKRGLNNDTYGGRPLYTDTQYEADKMLLNQFFANKMYAEIESYTQKILSTYRFNDDKLSTITALNRISCFDEDQNALCTKATKMSVVSGITDPGIYVQLFIFLDACEQSQLIKYRDIKQLPSLKYSDIESTEISFAETSKAFQNKIKADKYYRVRLKHRNINYYVYLAKTNTLCIIYIDSDQTLYNTYN